jgi:hypothetical protein
MAEVHHCPECGALVVDRRFPNCTTCHAALPIDWIMTPEQIANVRAIDQGARAEHDALMHELDPVADPNVPLLTPDDDPTEPPRESL